MSLESTAMPELSQWSCTMVVLYQGHWALIIKTIIYGSHIMRPPPYFMAIKTKNQLQPLDVGLFDPLKTTLSAILDSLIRTSASRINKSEWLLLVSLYSSSIEAFTVDLYIFGG